VTKTLDTRNYTFSAGELEQLKAVGKVIAHPEGDVLADENTTKQDFLVTLSGETHLILQTPEGPNRGGWMEPGHLAGDIPVITAAAAQSSLLRG